MSAALQLRGQGERPQQADVRAVRLLAQCSRTSPALLSDQERPPCVLPRKNSDRLAPSSLRICDSAIRCFSHHVLGRDWKTRDLMRAASAHRLPALLSLAAVHRLLPAATPLPKRVSCTTVSRGGLRRHAALSLQVSESESPRHMLHGPRGKGAKDRAVPLPHETLELLRRAWKTPRTPTWLLPACGRDHQPRALATSPRRRRRVQGACRTAPQRAGLLTRDVGGPPLRHASATPGREAGGTLRAMPRDMGQAHLDTPMLSLHLTHQGHEEASQRLDTRLRGFQS
jgi:integrase/recombinase XerD